MKKQTKPIAKTRKIGQLQIVLLVTIIALIIATYYYGTMTGTF